MNLLANPVYSAKWSPQQVYLILHICHQTYQSQSDLFLVLRTFKALFFSNFQICNAVLLVIVTMLYIASPWLLPFDPFTSFTHPTPSPWQSPVVLYKLGFGGLCSVLLVFKIPRINEIVRFLSLSVWLISPGITPIYLVADGKIPFCMAE